MLHDPNVTARDGDVAAHGAKAFDGYGAHDVALETTGGWAGGAGAIPPLWSEPPLFRTARVNEEGAPSGVAFPFVWPGAWVFAPTKATPKTSAVSAPSATLAERARRRARTMRESSLLMAGSVLRGN
jgi:hypothetical protein